MERLQGGGHLSFITGAARSTYVDSVFPCAAPAPCRLHGRLRSPAPSVEAVMKGSYQPLRAVPSNSDLQAVGSVMTLVVMLFTYLCLSFFDMLRKPPSLWWLFEHVTLSVARRLEPDVAHATLRKSLGTKRLPKRRKLDCEIKDVGRRDAQEWRPPWYSYSTYAHQIGVNSAFFPDPEGLGGFGDYEIPYLEVGPVTLKPQVGDIGAHRAALALGDRAAVDSYVVPSEGVVKTHRRLKIWQEANSGRRPQVFVHVVANHDSSNANHDIIKCIRWLEDAADGFVITPPDDMFEQPSSEFVPALSTYIIDIRKSLNGIKPLFLKLPADMTKQHLRDVAAAIRDTGLNGLILCSNIRAPAPPPTVEDIVTGRDGSLRDSSMEAIHEMYKLTRGSMPIIGSGGVSTPQDAYEKIRAGATLIQVGHALLVDHGVSGTLEFREKLIDLARDNLHKKMTDAIGADHRTDACY